MQKVTYEDLKRVYDAYMKAEAIGATDAMERTRNTYIDMGGPYTIGPAGIYYPAPPRQ